jgi:hypothetical protein
MNLIPIATTIVLRHLSLLQEALESACKLK